MNNSDRSKLAYQTLLTDVMAAPRNPSHGAWKIEPQDDGSLIVTCYALDHTEAEVLVIDVHGGITASPGDGSRMPTLEGDMDMLDIAEAVTEELDDE